MAALTCINFGRTYKGPSEGRCILLFMMIEINWQWIQSSVYFGPSCKLSWNIRFRVQGGKRPYSPQAARGGSGEAENSKQDVGNSMKCSSLDSQTLIKLSLSGCSLKSKGALNFHSSTSNRLPGSGITWIATTQPALNRSTYDTGILGFCSKWLKFSTQGSTAFN